MLGAMAELDDELARIADAARVHAAPREELEAVLPAEPGGGRRFYLCSYAAGEARSWLALDGAGEPVEDRSLLRDVVSIAAMCEIAEETAGGGRLDELRAQLVSLRLTEQPVGIEEAEEAALALEHAIGTPPRIASPAHLDRVGGAARRLELALGDDGASPFAEAMKHAVGSVEELKLEVESAYKRPLR
jgi:hypothetical protein